MRIMPTAFLAAMLAALSPVALAQSSSSSASTTSQASTWDKVEGNWTQFKGQVKEQWGKLTDDDLLQIQGQRQQLVGKIQKRYGVSMEEADKQVQQWEDKVAH